MPATHVFLSHTGRDDDVVVPIREALEGQGVEVWTDSRRLSGGDALTPDITAAIEAARHMVVVLSPRAVNSPWVTREIRHALNVRETRPEFKVIPVLLDGIEPEALHLWFGEEPVAVPIACGPGGVDAALDLLLAALGERLPNDRKPAAEPAPVPIAELILELTEPSIDSADGKRRATARARLTSNPPGNAPDVASKTFLFTAPLGPIEADDLSWYLERYSRWPSAVFRERAGRIEANLPRWGTLLYDALNAPAAQKAIESWNSAGKTATRRLTVLVDPEVPDDRPDDAKSAALEAATLLLATPWELIHDAHGYLFQGARPVRVRRRLRNYMAKDPIVTAPPIRVLLVSPRPEEEGVGYIDHRVSARPLVEALDTLGELAEVTLLSPPTFPALEAELQRAQEANQPYHVVHFDGHGVFDRKHGLGALCFEHPADVGKTDKRRSQTRNAKELAAVMRDRRIPLFFLEACQSARSADRPDASVAGKLLEEGVASVVAMSHSVLVETARRFVLAFYTSLMNGHRIGQAMLEGQRALQSDPHRGRIFNLDVTLHDWFVPVLFQEEEDPPLVSRIPPAAAQALQQKRRKLALGDLPDPPVHTFVGRSRELLRAERLLATAPYVVFRGEGGEGKTTLAAELARWLVATRRFRRSAFVSLETVRDARGVLHALGNQLVTGFVSQAQGDDKTALLLVERALEDAPTLIVLDNMESILPPAADSPAASAFEPKVLSDILALARRLNETGPTRLLFTTREPLPPPFEANHVTIDRLSRRDAIALVGQVLGKQNLTPKDDDEGTTPEEAEAEIEELVESLKCHARGLVNITREVATRGVRHATKNLHALMTELEAKYPGDRERSLLASVELSLRRLPAATLARIPPLGIFQGGGHLLAIAQVLGLNTEKDEEIHLAKQLVDVGLGEMLPFGYLRLQPALSLALLRRLDDAKKEAALATWVEAMEGFTGYLYHQISRNAEISFTLMSLDLANFLAALAYLRTKGPAERVASLATRMETLVRPLGHSRALAQIESAQAAATGQLGERSHVRFEAERQAVERLAAAGRFGEALAAAQALHGRTIVAGEQAYREAYHDLAMSYSTLGRARKNSGSPEAALPLLTEGKARFQHLADAGYSNALVMVSASINEIADCLKALGRLAEAAEAYQEAVATAEKSEDRRGAAVSKFQLGSVRLMQEEYDEAVARFDEARKTFEALGEPRGVAAAWHQIGMAQRLAKRYEASEYAYIESMKIEVQKGDKKDEADTLNELGNLYVSMGRREEAVHFHRQAAEAFRESKDAVREGEARNNLAYTLLTLNRHEEARRELKLAIDCKSTLGHVAQSWTTFAILYNLERAVGNMDAAREARRRAEAAYLAYRRDGGENVNARRGLYDGVAAAIRTGKTEAFAAHLTALSQRPDLPDYLRSLIPALFVVLRGARELAVADDPALNYDDAVNLRLLIESLREGSPER